MTTEQATKKKPLWLLIEEEFLALDPQAISGGTPEETIQRIAGNLDGKGYNVSKHGGHMVQLRFAAEDMRKVGRPLMKDFNDAIGAFTLDDVMDAYAASDKLINDVGATWPKLKQAECRPVVIGFVEQRKLDLLIEKAKSLPGDDGIELLINEGVDFEVITSGLEITEEKLKEVNTAMEKRLAERKRVLGLLEVVKDKSDVEKVRHLFEKDVAEPLILELAGVDQSAIDGAKKAMEEEIKEKQRLAEEEAARKKAEAEGPSLDAMSPEEILGHIEAIREIMEFSDVEKEIRTMCEQSALPKALVDIAVSDPAKLDELEKEAGG
jgi:hypothetical protein